MEPQANHCERAVHLGTLSLTSNKRNGTRNMTYIGSTSKECGTAELTGSLETASD